MAAPTSGPYGTTALIYNPTGADTNPIGDGWTTGFFSTTNSDVQRVSNKIASTSSAASSAQAYRAGATYGLGSEFWGEIAAKGALSDWIDFAIMISSPRVTPTFYEFEIVTRSGADSWDIYRINGGTPTTVATGATQEVTAGDYFSATCRDDGSGNPIVKMWYWALAGSAWTEITTFTDTSGSKIVTAGYMGIEFDKGGTYTFGNIYGGNISAGGGSNILVGTFDPALNPIGQF